MADRGRPTGGRRPRCSGRLLLAMGTAALLVGCGADAEPAAPAEASVPDALPGTPAEVEDALVTTDDLGEGWTDLGAVPLDERGFAECPDAGVITGGNDPARLGEAQSRYGEGDSPVPTFGVSVSSWASPDVARERLATFASVPSVCDSFRHEPPDGGTAMVTVDEAAAPALGDEAIAQVIVFDPRDGPTLLRDVIAVRIGDALVLTEGPDVAVGDPELDPHRERFRDLTGQAVDKAARVLSHSTAGLLVDRRCGRTPAALGRSVNRVGACRVTPVRRAPPPRTRSGSVSCRPRPSSSTLPASVGSHWRCSFRSRTAAWITKGWRASTASKVPDPSFRPVPHLVLP